MSSSAQPGGYLSYNVPITADSSWVIFSLIQSLASSQVRSNSSTLEAPSKLFSF